MKVFVAFLATILVASAAVPTGKKIVLNEDGSLSIYDQTLRQITFTKPLGVNGEKFVDVVVNAPSIPRKSIVLDIQYTKYGSGLSQVGLLLELFVPYKGEYISQQIYDDILYQVKAAVAKGEISPVIYAALQALDNQQLFGQLVLGQGVFARDASILGTPVTGELVNKVYGAQVYGKGYYGPYSGVYGQYYGQYYPQYYSQQGYGYNYPQYQQYQYGQGYVYGQGYPYVYGQQGYGYVPSYYQGYPSVYGQQVYQQGYPYVQGQVY